MVTGSSLDGAVVLSDYIENLHFLSAVTAGPEIAEGRVVDPKELRGRPHFDLWLFWGENLWEPYVREGRLDELRPDQANQSGRYYPAVEGRPAVVSIDPVGAKRLTPKALRILARHGIPVRVEPGAVPGPDDALPWPWIAAGVCGSLLVTAATLVVARRRWNARPAD
jgi:hypothetical protein